MNNGKKTKRKRPLGVRTRPIDENTFLLEIDLRSVRRLQDPHGRVKMVLQKLPPGGEEKYSHRIFFDLT